MKFATKQRTREIEESFCTTNHSGMVYIYRSQRLASPYMSTQHSFVGKAHSNLHACDEIRLVLGLEMIHSRSHTSVDLLQLIALFNRITVVKNDRVIVEENGHDHGGSAALQNKPRDVHKFIIGVCYVLFPLFNSTGQAQIHIGDQEMSGSNVPNCQIPKIVHREDGMKFVQRIREKQD